MSKEPVMFDSKGTCQYCSKPTRARATTLCNACYRLDLAIKNNPKAAQKILKQYVNPVNDAIIDQTEQTTWKQHTEYAMRKWKERYKGIRPKEEQ